MTTPGTLGFIGLGNMGGPMCANIAKDGRWPITVFDAAGTTDRAPADVTIADSVADIATGADTVLLSLPDGKIVAAVAAAIAATPGRRTTTIVDLSTIGVVAARAVGEALTPHGIAFVDAPVSGGRSGAIAGTITVMCAGPADAIAMLKPVFETMAGNVIAVGEQAGQGQAMKLANNFLSSVAMAATSEAVHFGVSQGLDMRTMLDVLNVSTGRNSATVDKFPNRIATGTFDAGFALPLMAKDVALYYENAIAAGTVTEIGATIAAVWKDANAAMPGDDFTRIYDFVGGLAAGAQKKTGT